ncbi:MAG TPA: sigma-70 family RNA polymerase sigma factor [Pirellulaceae bacterium]|nr:sigma-70 family RNA polymerase sigma factor [Pirellulaceae bacterium]
MIAARMTYESNEVASQPTQNTRHRPRCDERTAPTVARHQDTELICRLRARDREAFDDVIYRETPRLLNVAKRLLRNQEDAADAIQDTFLTAYLSIDSFQGNSSISTWLYRILVNNCLMKLRAQKRERKYKLAAMPAMVQGNSFINDGARKHSHVNSELERNELACIVRSCVNRLPADYQAVIRMRDFEGLDSRQTAQKLRISRGAVRVRLYRARQALRALVESAQGDPTDAIFA